MMDPHDQDERALLGAYRDGERMPAAARASAWARLQAAIAEGEAEVVAPRPGRRWVPMLLFAAALVVVIAGLRRVVVSRTGDADVHHAAPDQPESSTPERTRTVAPTPEPSPAVAPSLPESPTPAPPRPRVEPPPAARSESVEDPGGLDVELALLRAARTALTAGEPARALALIDEHERRLTNGHLVEERRLLQIQAMCALGQTQSARAAALRFAADYPGSPHTSTVAALCGP